MTSYTKELKGKQDVRVKEVSVMGMEPHHELSDKNTLCLRADENERAENKKWKCVSMENEIETIGIIGCAEMVGEGTR